MLLGDILNVCLLMFGSAFCVILGKCLLKFYSTILFADINIFTHLNKAAVIAIQLMVQSRVGGGFTIHVLKRQLSPDYDWSDNKNPSCPGLHRNSPAGQLLRGSPFPLWNIHLQHGLQDGSHFQGICHKYKFKYFLSNTLSLDCYPRTQKISFNQWWHPSDFSILQHGSREGVSPGSYHSRDSFCHQRNHFLHLWLHSAWWWAICRGFFCVLKMTMTSYIWNLDVHYCLLKDYICLVLKQKWWGTLREDQPLRFLWEWVSSAEVNFRNVQRMFPKEVSLV